MGAILGSSYEEAGEKSILSKNGQQVIWNNPIVELSVLFQRWMASGVSSSSTLHFFC